MKEEHYLVTFIKYNNAVPIALALILLGGGGAFAATNPEIQQSVYASNTKVQSIDNTFITSVNLKAFPFKIRITSVAEDTDYYYLAYTLDTIDVSDYVWRAFTKQNVLRISKAQLRDGDLQAYAESELAQVRDAEIARLTKTQELERKLGVSKKTVAVEYSGHIG